MSESTPWTNEQACRRAELVNRKYCRGHLTDSEAAEFSQLQSQFGEYQQRICPLPDPDPYPFRGSWFEHMVHQDAEEKSWAEKEKDYLQKQCRTSAIWQRWDMLMRQYPDSLADQLRITTHLAIALQENTERLEALKDEYYGKWTDCALKLIGEE